MNVTKRKILDIAISLFAEKGFHGTSVQDITDKSAISKGAFYLHFKSKDDLMIEIFQYYHECFEEKSMSVYDPNNSPKQNFAKQLEVHLSEVMIHKDFILMYLRENSFTLNERLLTFFQKKNMELFQWYTDTFIAMYGEQIEPFTTDIGVAIEGLKSGYFKVFLVTDQPFSVSTLTNVILHLCDELAEMYLSKQFERIIPKDSINSLLHQFQHNESVTSEQVFKILEEMQHTLDYSNFPTSTHEELQEALDFLTTEIVKPKMNKVVIQGVLVNFKRYEQFHKLRAVLSQALQIKLL